MLDMSQVNQLVANLLSTTLGHEALHVTIVLRGYDDRFPILSCATERDLAQDDDPES